jgi:hypothetical protein
VSAKKSNPQLLVQTWLPQDLGTWVKKRADEEGLSVAAWVRSLIFEEVREKPLRSRVGELETRVSLLEGLRRTKSA